MTSETWFGGGTEGERVAMGKVVGRGVATWGEGHVEAFVNIRGLQPVVETAMVCPLNGVQRDVTGDLQAELNRAGV